MKRTVFGILLTVVIAIVSVSCSERDNLSLNSVREVELLFALDTENGNMTRAISDGNSVDKLIYAVFAEDGTLVVRNAVIEDSSFFHIQ